MVREPGQPQPGLVPAVVEHADVGFEHAVGEREIAGLRILAAGDQLVLVLDQGVQLEF